MFEWVISGLCLNGLSLVNVTGGVTTLSFKKTSLSHVDS